MGRRDLVPACRVDMDGATLQQKTTVCEEETGKGDKTYRIAFDCAYARAYRMVRFRLRVTLGECAV